MKLKRRASFYRRAAFDQWLCLEADPAVQTFCERPGFVMMDGQRRLADFWVRYADQDELIVVHEVDAEGRVPPKGDDLDDSRIALRVVGPAELAAARVWLDNWQRMLPCIVANRDAASASLLKAIQRFAAEPRQLLTIEREYSTGDPVLVRAAVYELLRVGKLCAPALRVEALSLLTLFSAPAGAA
ncbi:hypothetical protein [Burkholderia pseudomallei]|uniref:hypothetical protein n=1 Tax=Burkholderia pseudomallei TaxID=28450 RepID=UPI0030013F8D